MTYGYQVVCVKTLSEASTHHQRQHVDKCVPTVVANWREVKDGAFWCQALNPSILELVSVPCDSGGVMTAAAISFL